MSQAALCWSSAAASPANSMSAPCMAARLPSWSVLAAREARTQVPAAALPRGLVRSSRSHLRRTAPRARRSNGGVHSSRRCRSEPPSLPSSARNGRSRISAPATPAAATSLGGPMSTVRRPTLEQMHDIVNSLHLSMSQGEVAEYLEVLEGTFQAYDRVNQLPDYLPPVRYPRTPGYRPGRQRESAQRLGGEDGSARRRARTAVRQARRAQG